MLRHRKNLYSYLIAGGLMSFAVSPLLAQHPDQEGIIRISDSVSPQAQTTYSGAEPIPENGIYCPEDNGYYGRGHRHVGQRFSPPVKRPIYRAGVAYNKMWPNAWTGGTGAPPTNYQYPTVYMPTDTTQLGYYYQHVPYWQPRPGMTPPPPIPRQWHTTVAQSQYVGYHPAGKVFGTAPTAIPVSPTPAPQISSQPEIALPQEESIQPIPPLGVLEKPESSPSLLPIE